MEQTVHREDGIEGPSTVEGEEVDLRGDEALRAARLDHCRRRIGADDFETGIREELAVVTGAGADLEQPRRAGRLEPGEEREPFVVLPVLDGMPLAHFDLGVVRLPQRREHRFVRLAHPPSLARQGVRLPGNTTDDFCSCRESKGGLRTTPKRSPRASA